MNRLLKISLLANLLLAGVALHFYSLNRAQQEAVTMLTPPVVTPPVVTEQVVSKPFRWSQLEAPDYKIYIANLRAIGCPEQTLRDIIRADVASLYTAKRQESGSENIEVGQWSRARESQLLINLLGDPPATITSRFASSSSASSNSSAVTVPLIYQAVDLTALALNSGQQKAIEELREQFAEQLGATSHDPSDPVYRERWTQLQPESDELLRGMIGINAFQNLQLLADTAHLTEDGDK